MGATETGRCQALWKCQGADWRMRMQKVKWGTPRNPEVDKGQTVPCSASLLNLEPSADAGFPEANFPQQPRHLYSTHYTVSRQYLACSRLINCTTSKRSSVKPEQAGSSHLQQPSHHHRISAAFPRLESLDRLFSIVRHSLDKSTHARPNRSAQPRQNVVFESRPGPVPPRSERAEETRRRLRVHHGRPRLAHLAGQVVH